MLLYIGGVDTLLRGCGMLLYIGGVACYCT